MDRGAWWATVNRVTKSLDTTEAMEHTHTHKQHRKTCLVPQNEPENRYVSESRLVNCKNAKQLGDSLNINREMSEKEK